MRASNRTDAAICSLKFACRSETARTLSGSAAIFETPSATADDEEAELDEADLETDYYPGEGLDLRPLLAEQVLLDLPMKPLCGEDCRGLCAQCGANRNLEDCDCEPPPDPRLAALGELRDRL